MKDQILKRFWILSVMLTVAFCTAIATANGQSIRQLTAEIPFDFMVGDRVLPAGAYTVRPHGQNDHSLQIQNKETNDTGIRLSNSIEPKGNQTKARLVFHRYGQTYFLAEVWEGGDSAGQQLIRSKREKVMQRELGGIAQTRYETIELVAALR